MNVGGDDKKQKGLKDKKPVSSGVDISETAIKLDPTQLKYLVDINSETTPTSIKIAAKILLKCKLFNLKTLFENSRF